jgi:hypothetical protein
MLAKMHSLKMWKWWWKFGGKILKLAKSGATRDVRVNYFPCTVDRHMVAKNDSMQPIKYRLHSGGICIKMMFSMAGFELHHGVVETVCLGARRGNRSTRFAHSLQLTVSPSNKRR